MVRRRKRILSNNWPPLPAITSAFIVDSGYNMARTLKNPVWILTKGNVGFEWECPLNTDRAYIPLTMNFENADEVLIAALLMLAVDCNLASMNILNKSIMDYRTVIKHPGDDRIKGTEINIESLFMPKDTFLLFSGYPEENGIISHYAENMGRGKPNNPKYHFIGVAVEALPRVVVIGDKNITLGRL